VNVHLPGNIRILRTLRRLRGRMRPGIAILGYHRVADPARDPMDLSTSAAHFEAHLEAAARLGETLRLDEAAAAIAAGRVPKRGIVFTFDDGYSDNLHTVLPLLERHRIAATMFVTSGNRGGEFWWDRLARIVAVNGRPGRAGEMAEELEFLPAEERTARLDELARDRGIGAEPVYRTLTVDELKRLGASPWIEIGAHTESHRRLPELPEDTQRDEVRRSRTSLEALLGRPVTSFAYPHGAISARTVEIVAAAGYKVACCSRSEVAANGARLRALPRLWPGNRPGPEFERWLRSWLHG
jgi:peptidoglycan/xylan/chitin deacetylase (PgdA/CDA1 family)